MITSYKNPKIRLVRDLMDSKKHRDSSSLMVLEGVRLAEEAITNRIDIQQCFFSTNLSSRGKVLLEKVSNKTHSIEELPQNLMDRLSDTQHAQGILLVCKIPEIPFSDKSSLFVALDRINDPGNMGTIIRTAAALKVDGVILAPGTTDPFSPKSMRAAMGAQLHLPIKWKNVEEIKRFCTSHKPHLELVSSTMDCHQACWETDLSHPMCLVIGNEANGISEDMLSQCDHCVGIPIAKESESFNAAIAAAILMYEIIRQRKIK